MYEPHHPLYIGIHGYAGSGKDTVTKMIRTILSGNWQSLEECKAHYKSIYTDPTISATYNIDEDKRSNKVFCIAFADQLKLICSNMFGIDMGRFYMNKETGWICLNKDFKYTEIRPDEAHIISAEEYYSYYSLYSDHKEPYYMSLREILIYIGTYVLQSNVNKNIFVNIVNNISKNEIRKNKELEYIICTDVRFVHEFDYIRSKHGILIDVQRNSVNQLDNIAEHDLDDYNEYDFVIDNSDTYDALFEQVWDMIMNNVIMFNHTFDIDCDENVNNYLRLIDSKKDANEWVYKYMLCNEFPIQKIIYNDNDIYMVNIVGSNPIKVNEMIETSDGSLPVSKIEVDENNNIIIYNSITNFHQ